MLPSSRLRRDSRFSLDAASVPAAFDPTNGAYYWMESTNLGLANDATVGSVTDESSSGANGFFVSGTGSPLYKTNALNGHGVIQTTPGNFYYQNAAQLGSQTIVFVKKALAINVGTDVLSNTSIATKLRATATGYDWSTNSGGSVQAVGSNTLFSWDTIIIKCADSPGPMTIRVNGTQLASFTPHTNWYGNVVLRIFPGGTGQIAAFGRYSSELSNSSCEQIESYLRVKYAHY